MHIKDGIPAYLFTDQRWRRQVVQNVGMLHKQKDTPYIAMYRDKLQR